MTTVHLGEHIQAPRWLLVVRSCAYLFAVVAAGALFFAHGWLARHHGFYDVPPLTLGLCAVPAGLVALAAHLVRRVCAATGIVAGFAAVLAGWSITAARAAVILEGVGIIGLGFTPWMQLFAIFAVLLPLLVFACFHHHVAARLDQARRPISRRG